VLFVAGEKPAVIAQSGDRTLNDPPLSEAAQRAVVLGDCIRAAVGAVRRDHLDAEFGQGLVEDVTVVGFVADESLGREVALGGV